MEEIGVLPCRRADAVHGSKSVVAAGELVLECAAWFEHGNNRLCEADVGDPRRIIAGSGSVLAIDGSSCLVDLASLMTRYASDEACGKTIPCRIGTRRLAELAGGLCSGHVRPSDTALASDLASDMRDAALCGLEAAASNPLLSGMRYFAAEFEAHIVGGRCPAGVCQPIAMAGATR